MNPPITNDIQDAARYIQEGRVVGIPTGTSYGLAADALQGHALQRVRNLKDRSPEKTFTVLVRSELMSEFFKPTEIEYEFIRQHEEQAFTILLTPTDRLAHLAHEGRVGLRICDHSKTKELLDMLDTPVTATSANVSGQPPCFTPKEVQKTFAWLVPEEREPEVVKTGPTTYDLSLACILDGGSLPQGDASTIVVYEDDSMRVVRQGAGKL